MIDVEIPDLFLLFQKYESFRDSLPDVSWLKDYLPENETVEQWREQFSNSWENLGLPDKVSANCASILHCSLLLFDSLHPGVYM
jgi:hypothetical protein